jgi:hypothetical protein
MLKATNLALIAGLLATMVASSSAQLQNPPISRLVDQIQAHQVSAIDLGTRIGFAFNLSLKHNWYTKSREELFTTGPADTTKLVRAVRELAETVSPLRAAGYRSAWVTLTKQIFRLRAPVVDTGTSGLESATQQIVVIQLVETTLDSTISLWSTLNLEEDFDLVKLKAAAKRVHELDDISTTALDRKKIGEIFDAYEETLSLCDDLEPGE